MQHFCPMPTCRPLLQPPHNAHNWRCSNSLFRSIPAFFRLVQLESYLFSWPVPGSTSAAQASLFFCRSTVRQMTQHRCQAALDGCFRQLGLAAVRRPLTAAACSAVGSNACRACMIAHGLPSLSHCSAKLAALGRVRPLRPWEFLGNGIVDQSIRPAACCYSHSSPGRSNGGWWHLCAGAHCCQVSKVRLVIGCSRESVPR
jgi:hypothetical protein